MELMMGLRVLRHSDAGSIVREVRDILATQFVGPGEELTCHVDRGGVALMTIDRVKSYSDQFVEEVGGVGAGYRGYVTAKGFSPSSLVGGLRWIDGCPALAESPGGIYSAFVVDPDAAGGRVLAWSSHGLMEGLFYSRGSDVAVVGTNPLAVHVVAQPDHRVRTSATWCRNVLVPASTMYDDTPFEKTYYVPGRRCVIVGNDGFRFEPHPVDLSGDDRSGSMDVLFDEAVRAVSVAEGYSGAQVSLSGGKDSRTVLALLAAAKLDLPSFTEGTPTAGEARTAQQLALAAGSDWRLTTPRFSFGEEAVWAAINARLRRSDGLIAENRHLVHELPTEGDHGVELHGQAHHLRGGYMTRVRYGGLDEVRGIAVDRFSAGAPYCVPELADDVVDRVNWYLDSVPVQPPALHLYWIYNDLRMARWLQGGFQPLRKQRLLIWPFLDERVLHVAANLSSYDRAMELAQYELIARSHPGIAAIPLYNDRWRFDQRGLGNKVHRRFHRARSEPITDDQHAGLHQPAASIGRLLPYVRTALNEFSSGSTVMECLSDAWRPVVQGGESPEDLIAVSGRQPLFAFMWRALAVATVLEGSWLPSGVERGDR